MKEKQSEGFVVIQMTPERALLGAYAGKGAQDISSDPIRFQTQIKNRLTAREMESITAICDTFVPSINAPSECSESVQNFYQTAASMVGTPEIFASVVVHVLNTFQPDHLLTFASSMYSCAAITIAFVWSILDAVAVGRIFFREIASSNVMVVAASTVAFIDMVEAKHREEILISWSTCYFYLLRMLFRAMKILVHLIFFTQLDDLNENHAWKALGYCGPDPKHTDPIQISNSEPDVDHMGPLYPSLAHNLRSPLDPFPSRKHNNPTTITCDVVVVGSGAGGGLVAGVLARAGYKVVVVEKGDYHARSNLVLLEGPSLDQMYEGNGVVASSDMGIVLLAGSTVGGGSAINWSACIRTPDHVISEWREKHGLELFGSEAYAEAMDVVCERMGVVTGKVPAECESLSTAMLRRGCHELGYGVEDIPCNAPRNHDCGWCCFGCRYGVKKGTHETWLVDLVDSGNGVILKRCKAIRVVHEDRGHKGRGATGVLCQYEDGNGTGDKSFFVESKVTVVACGALNTPVLLKRSGLMNPNIGKHLHLHPVVMTWGNFPSGTRNSYEGAILTAMSKVRSKDGYGALIQTPALHPGMFAALTPWVSSTDFKHRMTRFSRTAHLFALARDRGSGTVDSSGYIKYDMDPRDEQMLQRGIEKMIRIMAAAGAEEVGTQHNEGDIVKPKLVSSHEFEKFVKMAKERDIRGLTTPVCSAHQMGSCRMGLNEEISAVNERGESWEVKGLYVADSSIVPTAIGVNPMVTIQSIAYCVAQSILQELRRKIPNSKPSSVNV